MYSTLGHVPVSNISTRVQVTQVCVWVGVRRGSSVSLQTIYLLKVFLSFSRLKNAAIPLNKQLYTFSYVCVTSGAAALVFSAFYVLVHTLVNIQQLYQTRMISCQVCTSPYFSTSILTCEGISWQVDILEVKYLFLPFKWIGMNAMLVFVLAAEGIFAGFINGWYYDDPHTTLVRLVCNSCLFLRTMSFCFRDC